MGSKIFSDGIKGDLVLEARILKDAKYATDPKYDSHLIEVARGRTMKQALAYARKYHGY